MPNVAKILDGSVLNLAGLDRYPLSKQLNPAQAKLFPKIITPLLNNTDHLPACSAIESLERQKPFINQTLAYHSLAMLARLFRYGELTHHGGL